MDDEKRFQRDYEEMATNAPSSTYKSYALISLMLVFGFVGAMSYMCNFLEKNSVSGQNPSKNNAYKKLDTLKDYNHDGFPEFKADIKGKGIDTLVSHVEGKDNVVYKPIKNKDYANFE